MDTSPIHPPAPQPSQFDDLFTRSCDGDLEAFAGIVRHFLPRLTEFGVRLTGSAEKSRQLASRVLEQLARRLGDFRTVPRLEVWLFRSMVLALVPSLADTGQFLPPPAPGAAASLDERIREVLAGVPRKRREALVLKVNCGLSYQEIGAVLGESPATVLHWIDVSLHEVAETM